MSSRSTASNAGTSAAGASSAGASVVGGGLRAEAVTVAVAGREILHGVDLEVDPGEVVGLVGPNGSGKSTLLRCGYRALRPRSGRVLVGGDDVWALPARSAAQRVGAVVQELPSEFDLTVRDVVLLGRAPYKGLFDRDTTTDHHLVDEAMGRVGVTHLAERGFAALSGGEKQRVLLARALAQHPDVLVLDEPTNHLDIHYQLAVLGLVRDCGFTALVALHDLNIAAAHCDRIYVLAAGRIVAHGTPDEVFTSTVIGDTFNVNVDRVTSPGRTSPVLSFSLPDSPPPDGDAGPATLGDR